MNIVNQSEPESCSRTPVTPNLPTTLTAKQRYEQSEKGKERSRRRDALRRAQRRLDKMQRNRNRFLDKFGQRCGQSTESAGRTNTRNGVLDTSLTSVTVAEASTLDKSLKKFRRAMKRVNLLRSR